MRIGVSIPEQLIGFDPSTLRDYAELAEELGFAYLTLVDHVLGTSHEARNPPFHPGGIYTEESAFHEPLTLFAFLAAVTSRIELVTGVLVLPQRQTALVAKQAAEVSLLSGNRLRLGVGSGWNYVEYEALGTDYATRGRRLEEQVVLLRRLWSEPILDYSGAFHRIDRAGLRPLLDNPVPIWFGGFSAAQQNRCARIGDGMIWSGSTSYSRAANVAIKNMAKDFGRDPGTVGFEAVVEPRYGQSLEEALSLWKQAGGTHATLSPVAHTSDDPTLAGRSGRELLDHLPRLRRALNAFM